MVKVAFSFQVKVFNTQKVDFFGCKNYCFHRIEEGSPSIKEAMDVVEAGRVEVVDGEGDLQVRLQGHLQQLMTDFVRFVEQSCRYCEQSN